MLFLILSSVIAGVAMSSVGLAGYYWRARFKLTEDQRAMFELIDVVEDELKQRAQELEAFHHDETHLITLLQKDVVSAIRQGSTGTWQLQFMNGDRMSGELAELLARYHALGNDTELRIPRLTTTAVDLSGLKQQVIDILNRKNVGDMWTNPVKLLKKG